MNRIKAFGQFLWDFVVGDDWRIALGVVIALVVTAVLANNSVTVWWLLPVVVAVMLSLSVWTVARGRRP
ncbi:MAG: hypothetical protein FWD04_07820 [Conexibacteraceae bacterium]|nr:hypothetical protein [Conexibacteraceae bacterium]